MKFRVERASFERSLLFEFRKLFGTVRTWIMVLLAALLSTIPLVPWVLHYRNNVLGSEPVSLRDFDAVAFGNSQIVGLGGIVLAILGVLMAGHEMKGLVGQGTSLLFPRRIEPYVSRLAAGALLAGVFGLVFVPICYVITQIILTDSHRVGLDDMGVIRGMLGAIIYLILITIFAIGFTSAIRSQVLAIAILLPTLFTISTILSNIPIDAVSTATEFFPDIAGSRMTRVYKPDDVLLGPALGGLVMLAWASLAAYAGAVSVARRNF